MIEEALRTILQATPGLAACGDRFGPPGMPANTPYPFVTFDVVSHDENPHLTGTNQLVRERWQFDVYSLELEQVRNLARAMRAALNGYRGVAAGVSIRSSRQVGRLRREESAGEGVEEPVYREILDFLIAYFQT